MPHAAAELLERKPRVFWGRVVEAFIKRGWRPPSPDARATDAIIDAIATVEAWGTANTPPLLSGRELDVLAAVADGLRTKEIAERLWITESTVKFHLTNIREKLDARSNAHAVAVAMRQEWLG